jgi:hypothetical protein
MLGREQHYDPRRYAQQRLIDVAADEVSGCGLGGQRIGSFLRANTCTTAPRRAATETVSAAI